MKGWGQMHKQISQGIVWEGPGWYAPKLIQGAEGSADFMQYHRIWTGPNTDLQAVRREAASGGRGTPLYFQNQLETQIHFIQPISGGVVNASHRLQWGWQNDVELICDLGVFGTYTIFKHFFKHSGPDGLGWTVRYDLCGGTLSDDLPGMFSELDDALNLAHDHWAGVVNSALS